MAQIKGSVGRGGRNLRDDVLLIQRLINANLPIQLAPLKVDGICGSKTIFAIETYQKRNLHMTIADGRVDPGGPTLRALSGGGNAPPRPAPSPPVVPTPSGPVAINVAKPEKMRESAWRYVLEFTKKHEGAVFHMYNNRQRGDTRQDVTCGIGFRIDPRTAATETWVKALFYDPSGGAVTDAKLLADWDTAAALDRTSTSLAAYANACHLRMNPQRVYEQMALILRDQKLPALLTHPACKADFKDFENFPAAAQAFSLSFAYGRIPFDFPHMRASIAAGRWAEAADRCHVRGMSESKNIGHRQLLLFAQQVVDQGRDLDSVPASIL